MPVIMPHAPIQIVSAPPAYVAPPKAAPVLTGETTALPTGWYDGGIWNWGARFAASNWPAPFSQIPFQYDHVTVLSNGYVQLTLEPFGSAEIQARDGTPAATAGTWEVDVDLPRAKEGVIQAPLWLYDKTTNTGDEIDFEIVGTKGLQINVHAGGRQDPVLFPGNWSGRHRFGFRMSQSAGYVEMYADGRLLHRYDRTTSPLMVSHALKPMMSLWAVDPGNAGMASWAGIFSGFTAGEAPLSMTIRGYRFAPL